MSGVDDDFKGKKVMGECNCGFTVIRTFDEYHEKVCPDCGRPVRWKNHYGLEDES